VYRKTVANGCITCNVFDDGALAEDVECGEEGVVFDCGVAPGSSMDVASNV
jgi:hypothetical protein